MRISFQSLILLLPFASAAVAAGCNGDVRLCDRQYSNVTQIGAHNSPFVGDLPTENQEIELEQQLDMGIRFLQGQTHNLFGLGEMYMCHTSCFLLNTGPLVQYLQRINTWMQAHPNEVVTLLLTNQDSASVSIFAKAMTNSGLADLAYTPPRFLALSEWPTLQELIDSKKRLVMFLDYGADMTEVPYILDEFAYCWETPFSTTDPNFPECTVDRPPSASATGRFSIVNHVLDVALIPGEDGVLVPDILLADRTNSVTSILAQASLCEAAHGTTPNFVLVDYVNKGEVIKAQNMMNHLV